MITFSGGSQAKNIFWQVAGETVLGTTAHFEGVILSRIGDHPAIFCAPDML